MTWVRRNWFKLSLLTVAFLMALFIVFLIVSYLGSKSSALAAAQLQKQQQEEKEYTAKRKSECYGYFERERKQWNNVTGQRYDEFGDNCYIEYKESKPKTEKECDVIYKDKDGKILFGMQLEYYMCTTGSFEKII